MVPIRGISRDHSGGKGRIGKLFLQVEQRGQPLRGRGPFLQPVGFLLEGRDLPPEGAIFIADGA